MRARLWAVSAVLSLSLGLLAVGAGRATAVEHWPPWQSFGEAEAAEHARLKRIAAPQQNDIDQLSRKVSELRATGKLAEATTLSAQIVRLTEKRNGPNHPATAAALTSYADLLIAQKRYGEAEPVLKRVVAIHEKSKDNAATAQALDNLSQLYAKQGRAGDAKSAHERSASLRGQKTDAAAKESDAKRKAEEIRKANEETKRAAAEAEAKRKADAEAEAKRKAEAKAAKSAPVVEKQEKNGKFPPIPPIGSAAKPPLPPPAKPAAAPPPAMKTESKPMLIKPEAKIIAPKPVTTPQIGAAPPPVETMSRDKAPPVVVHKYEAPAPSGGGNLPAILPPPSPPPAQPAPTMAMPPPAAAPAAPSSPPQARILRREVAPPASGENSGSSQDSGSSQEQEDGTFGGAAPEAQPSALPPPLGSAPRAAARAPAPSGPNLDAKSGGGGGGAPPVAKDGDQNAPAAASGQAAKDQAWDVVPVFYGTDRAEEPNPKRVSYNSDRGRRLQLGEALVTVPKIHEVPQVERPWAIRIPYFDVTIYEQAEDPNKHFTMQEIKKLSKDDFLALVHKRLAGSARFKDEAIVFVHGYNTSFDNAVYRTAQIAYDLKFDGAPFLYSWPSGGGIASYTYDRESAEASKSYMRQFLEMVVKETGAKSISIIAHSMGNQPLLDVLKDMRHSAPEGVVISQVILAAPDVDADSFTDLAQAINGLAKGVTLYVAANDRALLVSRNFWGNYRAGDIPASGPLVVPGIDTIDVTAISTDTFALNHSDYAQHNELLKDIGELIATGLRPPSQRAMKPEVVTTDKGDYWRYVARSGP